MDNNTLGHFHLPEGPAFHNARPDFMQPVLLSFQGAPMSATTLVNTHPATGTPQDGMLFQSWLAYLLILTTMLTQVPTMTRPLPPATHWRRLISNVDEQRRMQCSILLRYDPGFFDHRCASSARQLKTLQTWSSETFRADLLSTDTDNQLQPTV